MTAKAGKLPKRVAGVKIPKKLRKKGAKITAVLENPIVAQLVAAALLAAAEAISKKPKAKKAAAKRQPAEQRDSAARSLPAAAERMKGR